MKLELGNRTPVIDRISGDLQSDLNMFDIDD